MVFGLGLLLEQKTNQKDVSFYVGEKVPVDEQLLNGELEVELTPQGTLAEKMRQVGAGIPAFFTATGYVARNEGKEVREFNGRLYIMRIPITGWTVAIVKAWKAESLCKLHLCAHTAHQKL